MEQYRVQPGSSVDLASRDPRDASAFSGGKQAGKAQAKQDNAVLEHLQELLYAEGKHKLLVVLQAMDTGGKDGTIRHVFDGTNPQGVKVVAGSSAHARTRRDCHLQSEPLRRRPGGSGS